MGKIGFKFRFTDLIMVFKGWLMPEDASDPKTRIGKFFSLD
jgi:hypothetical protein